MSNELKIINDENYQKWIREIKELVHVSQLKAAVQVNTEMIRMYWHIGKEISDMHADAIWGTGFYKTMSRSLKEEFPSVNGFSVTNLKYMKRFFEFYKSDNANRQQVVDDLEKICSIPWGHHILIMTKCENVEEALFYVQKTLENGWSRAMLLNFLDVNLYKSQGKAITNTSQVGTYVVAVNHQLKTDMDNPTIGLIICKTKDNVVAEYSLEASSVPIGISEYQLSKVLPKEIESSLPSIEEIEKSLKAIAGE